MTTTQQAIDTKYDYYLALRDEKLKTLFSPVILGWARQNGLNTFEDMVNYVGTLDFSSRHLKTLNGLDLLKALKSLYLANNQLTDVGDLSGLTALTQLHLYNNQLTNIGDLSGLTALTYFYLYNNNFATAQVDKVLADMHAAYDATGKIATIDLSGATMGIPTDGVNNADYVYLTNAGVSVTIRTA